MNSKINKNDVEFLIDCLKSGKEIPEAFKYDLFPTKQKEYELVYAGKARKEDILADKEEAKPVPLQIEKVFNGKKYPLYSKDWHNLLVFGDNLQILKTFNENKDQLVKNKIKGKVKLIYIDPPFATKQDFAGKKEQKAYSDRIKGAEFVEFLRRRLILMNDILAPDGSIFVHLDWKKGHYIKCIMDEIFGENKFRNEIVVSRIKKSDKNAQRFNFATDSIFWYSKTDDIDFKPIYKSIDKQEGYYHALDAPGQGEARQFSGKNILPPSGRHWAWTQEKIDKAIEDKILRLNPKTGKPEYWIESTEKQLLDSNWTDISAYSFSSDYPTEKNEFLLKRIIECVTNPGDLVMDVFAGSGTTLATAEKLGRRWIGCDIGKLAIYTTQKRLLGVDESRSLENAKKKYGKPAKSFAVVASGLYDLGKIFALEQEKYVCFVKDLFEIEETKREKIGGVEIDGMKRGFPVKIFPYWEMQETSVDEKYLEALHKNLGRKIGERFYIIAPANNVDFISDYHEIDDTKYYFLKVPYQIIKELHKVPFKKLHQPQSKSQINDLEEAKGFHFVRPPEVEAKIKVSKDKIVLVVKKFETAYTQDETGEKLKDFESLAMLLVDLNYDGDKFMMTHYFFAEDLLNHKKKDEDEESVEEIKQELKQKKEITREFPKNECGKQMMAIYVDIYGNEFREVFNLG